MTRRRSATASRSCAPAFPDAYWRELDARARVSRGVRQGADRAGYLAALIPEEYGGAGLGARRGVRSSSRRSTAAAATPARATRRCTRWARCCATARTSRSARYLPKIATGELRLQAFGVTEPTTGSDTTQLQDDAPCATGDRYVVNGQKIWISRAEHSDLMLLLVAHDAARAGEEAHRRPVDVFLVDLREAVGHGLDDPADPRR